MVGVDSRRGMRFVTRLRKIAFNSVNRDGFINPNEADLSAFAGLFNSRLAAKNEAGALVETNAPTAESYSSGRKEVDSYFLPSRTALK